jgi:hypothetical protein
MGIRGVASMPKLQNNFEFDRLSANGHRYLFTEKHHGGPSSKGQAQWLPSLELEEEFWVFDVSEQRGFFDENGRLFGMLKEPTSFCSFLGTRDEQLAIFYPPNAGSPWHGHPCYPLSGIHSRSGQAGRPSRIVFDQMVEMGLLTSEQARRLRNGNHI